MVAFAEKAIAAPESDEKLFLSIQRVEPLLYATERIGACVVSIPEK